jgi:hypothetical protein
LRRFGRTGEKNFKIMYCIRVDDMLIRKLFVRSFIWRTTKMTELWRIGFGYVWADHTVSYTVNGLERIKRTTAGCRRLVVRSY